MTRWRAWSGFVACDAAALCVAGVALGDIHLHFTWQAWRKLTSTVVLRGRRGTYGIPSFCVAGVAQAWHELTSTFVLRGRRGTNSQRRFGSNSCFVCRRFYRAASLSCFGMKYLFAFLACFGMFAFWHVYSLASFGLLHFQSHLRPGGCLLCGRYDRQGPLHVESPHVVIVLVALAQQEVVDTYVNVRDACVFLNFVVA